MKKKVPKMCPIKIGHMRVQALRLSHGLGMRPVGICPTKNRLAYEKWQNGPKVRCWNETLRCTGFRLEVTIPEDENPQVFQSGDNPKEITDPGEVCEILQYNRARFTKAGVLKVVLTVDQSPAPDEKPLSSEARRDIVTMLDYIEGRKMFNLINDDKPLAVSTHAAAEDEDYIFRRMGDNGDNWQIRFDGRDLPLVRHRKGMIYIRELLSKPAVSIESAILYRLATPISPEDMHNIDLSGQTFIKETGDEGASRQPLYDQKSKNALIQAQKALELKLAEELSDHQRDSLENELESVEKALRSIAAVAHKGELTFEPKEEKNPRQAVSGAIDTAINALEKMSEGTEIARHLKIAINKGKTCTYTHSHVWVTK